MRNLKKVLTLVLTVAMLLSVMVVGTGAAFSDQDSIKNKEAVDVCVALNIIGGMEDGSYRPANNVTRAQMCKMICIALNGGKEPTLGTNNTPTFSDVRTDPSSSWAESFIESCYSQGIVSGVGSGRFSPSGSVTGTQAARMLLVALGYRADLAGFTGDSWAINVNTAASAKGLYKGIESIDANAALSRDNAAQMIWNALNAYEVEYVSQLITDKDGKLTSTLVPQDKVVGGTRDKITLLADKYEAVTETGILNSVKYDSSDKTYTTKVDGIDGAFDAAQDYSSLMGQEVKVMYTTDNKTKDTVLLGIYATNTNKTVTTIYGDATINGNTAKIDGTEYDITGITTIATNGAVIKSSDYAAWTDFPYLEVTLVDNDKDKVYEYAVVNPYHVVKLTSLTAKKAYFDDTASNSDYSMNVEDLASYSDMAEKDYVYLTEAAYTVSGDWEAVKADTVSGKVSGIKGSTDKSIQVDGSWYKQAVVATGADPIDVPNNGDDLEYAVVANGYFFATEGSTGSADRLALVLKVGSGDFDSDYSNVKLLLSDGTTTTTKAYVKGSGSTKTPPAVGTLYTYTSNSDGYVLKAITNGTNIGMDSEIIDSAEYSSTTNKVGTTRVAADAKVFVLSEKDASGAYTGKLVTGATADKWADDTYDVTIAFTDGNVKIMVVDMAAAKIPNATDDSLYGVILSDPYTSTNDDGDTFYNMDLLTKDGVKEGVQVEDSEVTGTIVKNQFVSYKMDGDEYVDFNEVSGEATAVVGAVTDVDGKYITVQPTTGSAIELKVDEDDSTILYVDTTAGDAATGEIKKANKKDNENYYANIMVIYKKAAETDGTNVIWGAAFDVSNTLQNADDNDVLVAIP